MRIDVQDVSKRFGDFSALDDVSLEVAKGSLTALLGPSGSGKSTLLRAIAGLDDLDSGVVMIGGADVTRVVPQKRGIGFVFQHYAAFKHMTVRDNIAFGLSIRHRPKAEVKRRVDELLQVVGLEVFQNRYPAQLSGGQRQRMALARALAVDPKVLLLDEPTAGMGIEDVDRTVELIRRIRTGRTVVMVEHNMKVVAGLADRVTVLQAGRVLVEGPYAEIRRDPRVVSAYLGEGDAEH
jgi:sulfate transport system ATP-binding protein